MIIEYPEKNITDNSKNIKIKGVAEYNENERLSLEIEIISNNQAKPLIVVMLNPSESGKEKEGIFIDQTITNLIKIANENNYNKIKVFNLLTEKEPNSRKVILFSPEFFKRDQCKVSFLMRISPHHVGFRCL